jgi:hypothetical protein
MSLSDEIYRQLTICREEPTVCTFDDSELWPADKVLGRSPYTQRMDKLAVAALLALAVLIQPLLACGQDLSQEVDQI